MKEQIRNIVTDRWSVWLPYIILCALTGLLGFVLVRLDTFEGLYKYSRAHEDWELDEFFMVALSLSIGLLFGLLYYSIQLYRQIGRRRRAEAEARKLAWHDELTGLPNRKHFADRAEKLLNSAKDQNFSGVMTIDLDRFKPINDNYGHPVGDHVLQRTAGRLHELFIGKGIVSRMGGDEFTAALTGFGNRQSVAMFARHVCASLAEPIEFAGNYLTVSASIGVTCYPEDGTELESLLTGADLAMYVAKRNGGNTFAFFEQQLSDTQRRRFELEGSLSGAIEKRQIVPYLQPVLDLETGLLAGFEILSRWEHPTYGTIMPAEFIPIAEEFRQIQTLFESVLRQACEAVSAWHSPVRLAINVSPAQLTDDMTLVNSMLDILADSGFPPNCLDIEITEAVFISKADVARDTIDALHRHGVSVALDDFGQGYSSLSYLSQFDIDKVKIDKSFLTERKTKPKNEKIVASVIDLSRSLGMLTTAEGVESQDDAAWLRHQGCSQAQGYLYSKPMPITSALDYFNAHSQMANT